MLRCTPCLDDDSLATLRRQELDIPRDQAAQLGRSAVAAAASGVYLSNTGRQVVWANAVRAAVAAKRSLPPDVPLPCDQPKTFPETVVQVNNETTLGAARRCVGAGMRPLALNFANGVHPGGGFLSGARAQEEVLCRSSALHSTLVDDPMYTHHRQRPLSDSTDWVILSPDVPVFRTDAGVNLDAPWLLGVITAAAPYAPRIGVAKSAELMHHRIRRVLEVARAFAYEVLILGAWGCGAFHNDPKRVAAEFRSALEQEYDGAFRQVVFAITDWSIDRRFLGPFRDAFV
ncbi:MAG TPA: TIGR02452 family protein [Verrucomicrobiota bacterium]|nr:TIGR02452 family protein [Verrucomicrobiota bacterium]HNU53307.1 TIGR02452 family protein [Verrucomicrobiota bacterium]